MGEVRLDQSVYRELSLTTGVAPDDVERILTALGFEDELRRCREEAPFDEPRTITAEAVQLVFRWGEPQEAVAGRTPEESSASGPPAAGSPCA